MDSKHGMLEGVKVIEISSYLAVPSAGRFLAYMGAEVIKVESPSGDPYRKQGTIYGIPTENDNNPLFAGANDGKKFVMLDLKTETGRSRLCTLISDADIFITNLRVGAQKKLHVTFEELHRENQKLVYGWVNGYGSRGELANKAGFDSTAYFARGGHMLDYVQKGNPPNNMMLGLGDLNTAMSLVAGVLAAYCKVQNGGEGRQVEASLLGTSIWMASMDYVISQYGEDFFMDQAYQCKDGSYMYVQAITEKQQKALLGVIKMSKEEYNDHFGAIPKLRKIYKTKTFQEWFEILDGTGVCIERLRHIAELPGDMQARENSFLEQYGQSGKMWIPSPPVKTGSEKPSFTEGLSLGRDNAFFFPEE